MGYGRLKFTNLPFFRVSIIREKKCTVNYVTKFDYSSDSNKPRIYGFGLAEHGALGLKKNADTKVKNYLTKPVRHFFAEENVVQDVECGFGFTVFSVISKDVWKLYGCGINTDFQLGYHESKDGYPLSMLLSPVPINIGLQCPDTNIISLSAGRAHTAVVTDKEGLFLLGANAYGQCGRSIKKEDNFNGVSIVNCITCLGDSKITSVCCGQDHTVMLTDNGKVWACGWGCDGQTGLGHTNITPTPSRVKGEIENETIVKIAGKSETMLALSTHGEIFGWGNTENFQLSDDKSVEQINCPKRLNISEGMAPIKDIAAGGSFCAALTEEGDVYVWGYGILGGGPELQKSNKPKYLPGTLFGCSQLQPKTKVAKISCGLSHFAAINNYNQLYTWGRNRHGCLGIGHQKDQYFPFKVALNDNVFKVSCGLDHTMVLGTNVG